MSLSVSRLPQASPGLPDPFYSLFPAGSIWGAFGVLHGEHVVPGGNGQLGRRLQEQPGPAHLSVHLLLPTLDLEPSQRAAPGHAGPIQGPAPGTTTATQLPCFSLTPCAPSLVCLPSPRTPCPCAQDAAGAAVTDLQGRAETRCSIKHFYFLCLLLPGPWRPLSLWACSRGTQVNQRGWAGEFWAVYTEKCKVPRICLHPKVQGGSCRR